MPKKLIDGRRDQNPWAAATPPMKNWVPMKPSGQRHVATHQAVSADEKARDDTPAEFDVPVNEGALLPSAPNHKARRGNWPF